MRWAMAALLAGAMAAPAGAADFDYWVLALSWSPTHCDEVGTERGDEQCAPGAGRAFVVHGLWPQYERGWPEYCRSDYRHPSRRDTRDMADLTGSAGLAWHSWKKHGTCSGLSPDDYFATMRAAAARVRIPKAFNAVDRKLRSSPERIEAAFRALNSGLPRDGVTVTCAGRAFDEVRVCLDKSLEFRVCGRDSSTDCSREFVSIPAIK